MYKMQTLGDGEKRAKGGEGMSTIILESISYVTAAVMWACSVKEAVTRVNSMVISGELSFLETRRGCAWWRFTGEKSLKKKGICQRCGLPIVGNIQKKYCSGKCRQATNRVDVCVVCKKEFKYQGRAGSRKYCGRSCEYSSRKNYGGRANFGEIDVRRRQ